MDESEPVYRASADWRDHLLAHRLAAAAGDLLCTLRAEAGGAGGAELGGEGDRRSDDFLHGELAGAVALPAQKRVLSTLEPVGPELIRSAE